MKRRLLIGAACALLGGCTEAGYNQALCRTAVSEDLHTVEVTNIPNAGKWYWLARTLNGDVWYVETTGYKAEVTAKTIIFKGSPNDTTR